MSAYEAIYDLRPLLETVESLTAFIQGLGQPAPGKTSLRRHERLEVEAGDDHEKAAAIQKAASVEYAAELKQLRLIIDNLCKQRLKGKSKPGDTEKEDFLKKQLEDLLQNEHQPPSMRWFRINDLQSRPSRTSKAGLQLHPV